MTFVQENKRAVVMLAVVVALALVVGAFMLLTGGSAQPEAGPVPKATPTATAEPEPEQTQSEGSFAPTNARSNNNPFAPLPGAEKDPAQDTKPAKSTKKTDSPSRSGGASSKGSFADPGNEANPEDPVPEPDPSDPADKDPQPVEPEPIDDPTTAPGDGKVSVKVLSVGADTVEARINGANVTLYLAVPDESGVIYMSNLGGGCAWLASPGDGARVTICQGQTETM